MASCTAALQPTLYLFVRCNILSNLHSNLVLDRAVMKGFALQEMSSVSLLCCLLCFLLCFVYSICTLQNPKLRKLMVPEGLQDPQDLEEMLNDPGVRAGFEELLNKTVR